MKSKAIYIYIYIVIHSYTVSRGLLLRGEKQEISSTPSVFELTGLKDWPLKGGIRNVGQLLGLPVEGSNVSRSSYLNSVTPNWLDAEGV